MPKRTLPLYVDTELVDMAKKKGFILSHEFTRMLQILVASDMPEKEEERDKEQIVIEDEIMKMKAMLTQKKQVLDEIKKEKDRRFREKYGKIIKTIEPRKQ